MPSGNPQRQIAAASVQGFSHRLKNLPNQDAFATHQDKFSMVALADGHGSSMSFRSHLGSKIAVHSAIECAKEWGNSENAVFQKLFSDIVDTWRATVELHLQKHPFSVNEKEQTDLRFSEDEKIWMAYGSTLLCSIETKEHHHLFQIGDGDILILLDDDTITRPIAQDPRLFANATTSLCSQDAKKDFYWTSLEKNKTDPKLIMLSTDGYSNSYRSEEDFLQVARDIWTFHQESGIEKLRHELEPWLFETSEEGSGDDITAAFLIRGNKF